jgi:two-component system chemotaxis sensor kinase CheA
VIIESGNQKLAVAVDEIIGIRQCVLKPLEGIDMLNEYIQGVAVMGDSSVALVLNIEKVFTMQKAM